MATKATSKAGVIALPEIKIRTMRFTIEGDSPMVTHNWDIKALEMIAAKQRGAGKAGKEARVPEAEFMAGLYVLPECKPVLHDEDAPDFWAEGRFGFKSVGMKCALVRAATDAQMKMSDARRAFHVDGDLVEIHGGPPVMDTSMVRIGMGTSDIRYRPRWDKWHCNVQLRFNAGVISAEQIANLVRIAGFGVGLCEWRPEKGGPWGMFSLSPKIEISDAPEVK